MTSQLQLLNKILQTQDFSSVIMNNLDEDYFFNYVPEFKYIRQHYDKYGKVPDKLSFATVFPEFDFVEVNEPDSFLLQQLMSDYNTSYLANKFNYVKRLIENGKIDEAVKYFTDAAANMRPTVALTSTNLFEDTSRYTRYVDRATGAGQQYIRTGFDELDADLGGIDPENENMIIAARTGIGKTWTLIKMAVTAAQQKLRVGIYSGEMSKDKVGYRIDTLLGGISNRAITRGDPIVMSQYKNFVDHLDALELGPIFVITPEDINGPATVNALETFVAREKLDILFVDQYSLLEDINKAKVMWERVGNISRDIKLLQVKSKIPIISVAQMNRTKSEDENGKKTQDTTQIGLADRIGQDATVVIMLDRDKENDTLTLNVVKARDGGDGKKFTYQADFNSGEFRFIDDNPSPEVAKLLADSYSTTQPAQNAAVSLDNQNTQAALQSAEVPQSVWSNFPWDN